ncbi:hypothetical protein HWV07_03005 [Natronomonas salina]|uniref:hypothetical protein n=1 Tax=Natronomonas salina TaxID=1710540 RepID=UPI0015B3F4D9|nr:hypothetical protein [Natronomonas salina]QLD88062.1 hypothetical protein HWV07_03005 [Natronomonas salina]
MPIDEHLDVGELQSELGGALRTAAVGDVESGEYEVRYMRPDVEREYSRETQDRIFESLVFEYLGSPARESDFEPLGELQFTTRSFENGHVVMCWSDETLLFVALDGSEHFVPVTMRLLREQAERPPVASAD